MRRSPYLATCLLAALATGGCATTPMTQVRALGPALASDKRPIPLRLAEAQAHFRLGNVALAAEGFRKALREDPQSVDAMNGLAACYDRFGRFDLSHSYYQQALALAPDDQRLYANLATSLALQGRAGEAAKVRNELAARLAAGRPSPSASAALGVAAAAPAAHVAAPGSDRIEDDEPATMLARSTPAAQDPLPQGPRLERTSLAEVMLVTTARARSLLAEVLAPLKAAPTRQTAALPKKYPGKSASAAPAPSTRAAAKTVATKPLRVTVLNAARIPKVAAGTRERLQKMGWPTVAVGDSEKVHARSIVAFAPPQRAEARRLARSLGIRAQQSRTIPVGLLLVIVGRDSASEQPNA